MNVILLMIDSLNRPYMRQYGAKDIQTPNFDRLAKRCVTMDRHFTGSLPTMPTRHEVFAGRCEYLWKGWGPLEPYDVTLGQLCKDKGVVSMMITDTYHYWMEGSGNYHTDFDGFEFLRGHEADLWVTDPTEPFGVYKKMVDEKGDRSKRYLRNTAGFRDERDFYEAKLFNCAADWLDENHKHDNFFLTIDSFGCHEPWYVPAPYDRMYDPDYDGEVVIWPNYGTADELYPKEVLDHTRALYKGKLTMLDKWMGLLIDRMDRYNLWDDTLFIMTTDHGVHIGEYGLCGKNMPPYHDLLIHIPMMISAPGMTMKAGGRSKLLTNSIDLYPTVADALGLKIPKGYKYDGFSMMPALKGKTKKIRDICHTGYFGAASVVTDGKYALHQFPQTEDNQPLHIYGIRLERFHMRTAEPYIEGECGEFLPFTNAKVFKVPSEGPPKQGVSDLRIKGVIDPYLFDLDKGDMPPKDNIIKDKPEVARKLRKKFAEELKRIQAPEEQFVRLGLND